MHTSWARLIGTMLLLVVLCGPAGRWCVSTAGHRRQLCRLQAAGFLLGVTDLGHVAGLLNSSDHSLVLRETLARNGDNKVYITLSSGQSAHFVCVNNNNRQIYTSSDKSEECRFHFRSEKKGMLFYRVIRKKSRKVHVALAVGARNGRVRVIRMQGILRRSLRSGRRGSRKRRRRLQRGNRSSTKPHNNRPYVNRMLRPRKHLQLNRAWELEKNSTNTSSAFNRMADRSRKRTSFEPNESPSKLQRRSHLRPMPYEQIRQLKPSDESRKKQQVREVSRRRKRRRRIARNGKSVRNDRARGNRMTKLQRGRRSRVKQHFVYHFHENCTPVAQSTPPSQTSSGG